MGSSASWTDLSALERDVLAAVRREDDPRARDLYDLLGWWYGEDSPAENTIQYNLRGLVDKDLVERYDDPDDGRVSRYRLTHDGGAVLDQEARFLQETVATTVAADGSGEGGEQA